MSNETKTFFQKYGLQLTLQSVGIFVLILNLWLATKLAPLAQNIELLNLRVSASEEKLNLTSSDHTDIQIVKEQILNIRNDIGDMKVDLRYLREHAQ